MRYRTRDIELEAVLYDGTNVPEFAASSVETTEADGTLKVTTSEGERICRPGDYLVHGPSGPLVRAAVLWDSVFEPVEP